MLLVCLVYNNWSASWLTYFISSSKSAGGKVYTQSCSLKEVYKVSPNTSCPLSVHVLSFFVKSFLTGDISNMKHSHTSPFLCVFNYNHKLRQSACSTTTICPHFRPMHAPLLHFLITKEFVCVCFVNYCLTYSSKFYYPITSSCP